MASPSQSATERKTRVFISYSRKDGGFAEQLRDALVVHGYDAYLDKHDIGPGEPWRERLSALITRADAVVFCLSPNFVTSPVCDWEVNEAERLGKRLLPAAAADTPDEQVPQRLKRLNYTFMRTASEFPRGLQDLISALDIDIAWIREHTRIAELAAAWDTSKRADDLLLRGEALASAELWISSHPPGAPEPAQLQRRFVTDSRIGQQLRDEKERKQIARTRRFQRLSAYALSATALLVGLGLAATLRQIRQNSESEARIFAALAADAAADDNYPKALRYAVAGLPPRGAIPFLQPWPHQLEAQLANAAFRSRLAAEFGDRTGGHARSVQAAPDGSSYAALTDDRLKVWDGKTRKPIFDVAAEQSLATWYRFRYSPKGGFIATPSASAAAIIFDARTGSIMRELEHTSPIGKCAASVAVAYNHDGTLIAAACRGQVVVWEAATGAFVRHFEWVAKGFAQRPYDLGFAPDGSQLAAVGKRPGRSGEQDTPIMVVWDFATGERKHEIAGHTAAIYSVAFSPDGSRLLTSATDGTVRVWSTSTWKELISLQGRKDRVSNAVFSPDGSQIATIGFDRSVRAYSSETFRELFRIGLDGHPNSISYTSDGHILIGVGGLSMQLYESRPRQQARGIGDGALSASFSPDGRSIVAGGTRDASIWDASSGNLVLRLAKQGQVKHAIYSRDGQRILAADQHNRTVVWNASTGDAMAELDIQSNWSVSSLSNDGTRYVTTTVTGCIDLWSAPAHAAIRSFECGFGPTTDVDWRTRAAISPDGSRVAGIHSDDPHVGRVWNADSGEVVLRLEGHTAHIHSFSFSPDGSLIVTSSRGDGTARVWDAIGGTQLHSFSDESVETIAEFSRDGRSIVTTGPLNPISLWDVRTGTRIATLDEKASWRTAEFSPDSTRIVLAGWQTSPFLWDVTGPSTVRGEALRDFACNTALRVAEARAFSVAESKHPILFGREDLRRPCDRLGPLTVEYWRRLLRLPGS